MQDNLGPFLLKKDPENGITKKPTQEVLKDVPQIALYFSASWCGPCKKFTPLLKTAQEKQAKCPIIFVTADMDESDFDEYQAKMPWLAVPFGSAILDSLATEYNVSGIPRLVIIDAEGNILDRDARNTVVDTHALPVF